MKQLLLCFLSTFFMLSLSAQQEIYGIVTDDNGIVESANIIIKNTTIGTTTDTSGTFKIKAQPKDTLVVSYIGNKPKEIPVGTFKTIKVELNEIYELEAVSVIAQVTKREKKVICCRLWQYNSACGVELVGIPVTVLEPEKETFTKLYPNPSANGKFQLQLKKEVDDCKLYVSDMTGRNIQILDSSYGKSTDIDLSGLPSGMYLISVTSRGKLIETKKAIIR